MEMTELLPRQLSSRMAVRKPTAPNDFPARRQRGGLADTTCGYARLAHPPGAESFTTIELKSNHPGTVRGRAASCTATAQHLGATPRCGTRVGGATRASGAGSPLFRCTQMVLWPR